ncbi:MAG: type III-A CRISPR-associated RAMP protein Csm5 [Syntrophomonadaceae bacterium]|nr:type III-A CRISPR-associated RAMP protein Csm5 [Syntrophomonadaceae bacterium]
MKSHLRSYTLTLKTLSPLFIGSGKEIHKKEYVYVPRGQSVYILDIPKFSRFLADRGLVNEYTEFMLGNQNDLYKWLHEKKVNETEIKTFAAYRISAADALKHNSNLRGIQLFIKDNCLRPYVPGSSLKGAIRTAILAKMLSEKEALGKKTVKKFIDALKIKEMDRTLASKTRALETDLLHTLNFSDKKPDALNSVMRGLQISDSEPVSTDNLILTVKIDLTVAGNTKPIPIFREAIKPGVSIKLKLTLNPAILETAGIDIDLVKTAIRDFASMQEKYFFSAFKHPHNSDSTKVEDGLELYLGGGVGYVSKTVSYAMGGRDALEFVAGLMNRQFRRHKHEKDQDIGVSPHILKGTYYNNLFYRMGRCAVEIS